MNHNPRTLVTKLLALPLAAALCLSPTGSLALASQETAPVCAVSAPSPLHPQAGEAATYRLASAQLTRMGMDRTQCGTLWARFGGSLLPLLASEVLSPARLSYFSIPNFRADRLNRYQTYQADHPQLSPEQVVTLVNMDLDVPFYGQISTVSQPDSLTVLVNKYNALDQDYVPALEVLGPGYGSGSLHPEAARQFRAMADAARQDGIVLHSVSAYRSYSTQAATYNRYLSQYSQSTVDEFSARPGHSEHQTGLALDINVARTSAHFETTPEYAWLLEHCADYGFLLRYPEGKQSITGYRFEPWHYRYVGTEIAHLCMEQELTYEEYLATRPSEDLDTVPPICYQGCLLELHRDALVLNDICYLSADAFAACLGWAVDPLAGEDGLLLQDGQNTLSLYPGLRVLRNGEQVRLTAPALSLDETLYLALEDLCMLMDLALTASPTGFVLTALSDAGTAQI